HTIGYVSPDDGGPPGQTALENLGPMIRFHHRIKTHGRWQVAQPFNGVFVWRSPNGRYFLVDHTGTQELPGWSAEPSAHTDVRPSTGRPPRQQPMSAAEVYGEDLLCAVDRQSCAMGNDPIEDLCVPGRHP
ncbi:MAG: hypothetical protein ABJA81_08860, partial [Nocardioidaceae bacterium]